MHVPKSVVVVIGVGGMGLAVAQRLGSGAHLVLADVNPELTKSVAEDLRTAGFDVTDTVVDVGDEQSVSALARMATGLGPVKTLVHTAGLSPAQASVDAVLRVDLLGTALVLDAFGSVMARGGAGVVIASMAGTLATLDAEFEGRLAVTASVDLLSLPELASLEGPGEAYGISKRANQVRVRAAAVAWGRNGVRLNSLSPGVISTPMGLAELHGEHGDTVRGMVTTSAAGRLGTPYDIAAAVAFLVGPESSFITGVDLLVDGGFVASLHAPRG